MTTTPESAPSAQSFQELYDAARGPLYQALATITDDRDIATEAIDLGFTRWRRRIRKPAGIAPDAGVMAAAYKFARTQQAKPSALSGFRLHEPVPESGDPALEQFRQLSTDERAVLVMQLVLGWGDAEVGHAVGAHGIGAISRSIAGRFDGTDVGLQDLQTSLRTVAAGYAVPLSRLEAVKAKGTIQRLGVFTGAALVTAAVVGGGAALVQSLESTPDETAQATQAPTSAAAPGVGLTAENAVWQRVSAPVAGDNIMALAHDGTNYYLLASDQRGRPVMMQSENGLDWAALPGPPADQNSYFQQIIATPDVLIAVGNGFDEIRGTQSTLVFTSTDRETWVRADLSIDNQVEVGGQVFDTHTYVNSVSVSDSGFTIVGNQGAEFDPHQLLKGVVDDGLLNQGWGFDSAGMEFYGNDGQVIQRMTWEELGLDPAVGSLLGGGRPILWSSSDGVTWEMTEADAPAGVRGVGAYATFADAEALLAWGEFGQSVWVKTGDEWERPDIDGSLNAMTVWNDTLIVAGSDLTTGESAAWTSTDGLSWQKSSLPVGGVQQFFTSTQGIVGFGWHDNAVAIGPAEFMVDSLTVRATSDGRFVVVNVAGETIAEVFDEGLVHIDNNITINDPETDELVVQFDQQLLDDAWAQVYQELESRNVGPGPPQVSMLLSTNGQDWTVLQPDDANFFPQSVAFGDNSLLMAGWSEGGGFFEFGGGGQQLLLVTAE